MVEEPLYDTLVVGGGISGLICAYRLQSLGHRVLVVEQRDRVGGAIESERSGDFLLEWGAHTVSRSIELEQLIDELGVREEVVSPPPTVRNRFLAVATAAGGIRMQAAPLSLRDAIGSPILTLPGKLRALCELAAFRRERDDISVATFIERRFGRELLESVVAPALNGVWAGDVNRLSARYSLPRLWESQLLTGSAVRGLRRKKGPRRPHGIFSFRAGMAYLPLALAAKLNVETSTAVSSLEIGSSVTATLRGPGGERLVRSRTVVLSTGARTTAQLLHAPELSDAPYSSLGLLQLSFSKHAVEQPLDGFGVLVAPKFDRALLGAIFTSSLFSNRAPAGAHLISCFVGGARQPELADVTALSVQKRVERELSELIGAKGAPRVVGARLLRGAIPAFEVGHGRIRTAADSLERAHPPLRLLGSWREGISVPDRARLAEETARALHHQLGEAKLS